MDQQRNITCEEDEALILDSVREFLKRDVAPYAHDLEARDEYPQEIADKMAELGLFGTTISAEYGGLGLSCITFAKIMEEIVEISFAQIKLDDIPEITPGQMNVIQPFMIIG